MEGHEFKTPVGTSLQKIKLERNQLWLVAFSSEIFD